MGERQQAGPGESDLAPADERQQEARRILDRIERESASGGAGLLMRGVGRTARHLSAHDVDKSDNLEVWGTRIGRLLGLLFMLAIIAWLFIYLMQS